MRRGRVVAAVGLAYSVLWPALVWAQQASVQTAVLSGAAQTIELTACRLIETAARTHDLPIAFLTRLVWAESNFNADAMSRAGARGIAQFMPQTAAERGLADPFDPEKAIPKAAEFLAELRQQFGNLGLAAAAYNAGPARVSQWLQARSALPSETRDYVYLITERPIEEWASVPKDKRPPSPVPDRVVSQSCLQQTAELRRLDRPHLASPPRIPSFETRLANYLDKALAKAANRAAFADTSPTNVSREDAQAFCNSVRTLGVNCVAYRR